jgi:hypothetical protein
LYPVREKIEVDWSVENYIKNKAKIAADKKTEVLMSKMIPEEEREWIKNFPEFIKAMTERMKLGHKDYGDVNFSNDILSLLDEMCDEMLDTAVYAYITRCRILTIKSTIRTVLGGAHELGDVLGEHIERRSSRE